MSAPVRNKRKTVGSATSPRLQQVAALVGDVDETDGPIRLQRNATIAPDISDYLEEIVAQAPPMTAQARAKLAALLGRGASRRAA
ncbi:hypothetical protein AB0M13_09790 [Nocardia fluminea]|uniref:hypothetical protein n=1 Tax=Nocardia fluminea TaxID=134984 RepID=UPI003415E34C